MISNGNSTEKSLTTRTQQTVPHRAVLCRPNHKRRRECCGIGASANRGEMPNDIQKRSKNLSELRTKGKFESCDCSSVKARNRDYREDGRENAAG